MGLLKNVYFFWSILIVANIIMYVFNVVISFLWSKHRNLKSLEITRPDIKASLMILLVNILTAIPGYFLFINGRIIFTNEFFFRDLLILILVFDFFMYFLHFLSHKMWPFKILHKHHHTHKYFNEFSLYVMHPLEAFFFGMLLTIFAYVFNLNFYSFLLFIFFNWVYGVVAHLNTNSVNKPKVFGNSTFHKIHHSESNCNYGFYFVLWDSILGTQSK
ncbi:MAG: sterol desaturase family protein [Cyclobacteriaceae bacterium]|nr:sterol desaturase family protein [Cyclobacteriaceae bacterium]